MHAFALSLGIVFLAELGDKTQLVALCLASRYRARIVLAGITVATLVVHVFSVLLGGGIGKLVPDEWIQLIAGISFIGFGLWTLRGDSLSQDECDNIRGRSPFWLVFTTFFLAELGDKTMLSTVALATTNAIIPVWLGSTAGMVLSDGLAIIAGKLLGAKLPERAVKIGAAVIFFAFGAYSITTHITLLPPAAWLMAAVVIGAFIALFIRSERNAPVVEVE
jgi:Ca2+/H+ antiporter, TMEM165/GDT1 family